MRLRPIPYVLAAAATLTAAVSCGDDETAPALVTELAMGKVDASGRVTSLTNDEGQTYAVANEVRTNASDTTLRVSATYVRPEDGDGSVTLYSATRVSVINALALQTPDSAWHAPVKLKSVWKRGKYINIYLGLLATSDTWHTFAWSCDSARRVNGRNLVYTTLLHSRSKSSEYYTSSTYISIDTDLRQLRLCDSVSLTIPTYEGDKTYGFTLDPYSGSL